MNELKSYTEYAVSTPTADFVIGFDFNYGEDAVNVTIDDVPATEAGYTVVYLNETTIRLSPSVPSGVVRLQRETDIDQTDHAYRAGAKFIAQTMDENFEQLRHSQQEVRDGFSKLSTDTYAVIGALDETLELAQDAAQDAQDAAVIAQDAADTVNAIIIGGKVVADKVLDESGLSQQQINTFTKSLLISPMLFGAKGDGATDDSSALNAAINFAIANSATLDGQGKTYACHSVLFDSNLNFKNANLICNKFDQDMVSVLECTSYDDDPRWLENVYFENIHVDGKRQLHTGVKDGTLSEDGGRSAFRIIRPVNGLTMVNCTGNNSACDGLIIFPHGFTKGNDFVLNVNLTDCEFSGNRRHGGSSNSVNGMNFTRVTCNGNGLDIDDTAPLNSGLRGDRTPVGLYGSGWDCEEYLAGTVSTNMYFNDCEMLGNAKMGFLALYPPEMAEYPKKANIYFNGGRYDRGLAPTAEEMSILLSPNGTPDIQMFNNVSFRNVDCRGAAISVRSVSNGYFENIINGFLHALQYTNVTVLGDFVALALTPTSVINRVFAPNQDLVSITGNSLSINTGDVDLRKTKGATGNTLLNGHSNNAMGSSFGIRHLVNNGERGAIKFILNDFGGSYLSYSFDEIEVCGFDSYGVAAAVDGAPSVGNASKRFKDIYLVNAPTVSSDARLKKDIRDLSEKEKLVASDLKKNIKIYRLIDSDESLHIGIIAQEVVEIFDRYGLNAHDYSLIHYEDGRYSVRYAQLNLFLHSVG